MNKADLKNLSIPQPCPMLWSKMDAVDCNKFCNSCSKIVYDFTNVDDTAIIETYNQHNGNICVKMSSSQLPQQHKIKFSHLYKLKFIALTAIAFIGIAVAPINAQQPSKPKVVKINTHSNNGELDAVKGKTAEPLDEKKIKKRKKQIPPIRTWFRKKYKYTNGCPRF